MFNPGDTIKLDSGKTIRLDRALDAGGQGAVYTATDLSSRQVGVFKAFNHSTPETVARLRALVSLRLDTVCPVLVPPTDTFIRNGSVGSYASFAPGETWEKVVENYTLTFMEALQLGAALSQGLNLLHQQRVIHGDLCDKNLLIHRRGTVLRPSLIDLDNFKAPGVPDPPMVGQKLYMAPELLEALRDRRPAIPDVQTELYALGLLVHEIMLVRHPQSGQDATEDQFHNAVLSRVWYGDPARADRVTGVGGVPVEVLNADLMRLFRRVFSRDRGNRPTAAEWVRELSQAIQQVVACPNPSCGCPCLIDASKMVCPLGHPFPVLRLLGRFGRIALRAASTSVGRDSLGGSSKVSATHAVIRRNGPEYRLESVGRNGTDRWANGWLRLPDHNPVLIQKGDRLRFADVEVQVVEV